MAHMVIAVLQGDRDEPTARRLLVATVFGLSLLVCTPNGTACAYHPQPIRSVPEVRVLQSAPTEAAGDSLFIDLVLGLLVFLTGVGFLVQRRSMRALAIEERKYRDLFENAKDVVFTLDEAYRITDISPSIETVTGRPREDLVGSLITKLAVHERERRQLVELLDRVSDLRSAGTVQIEIEGPEGDCRVLELSARIRTGTDQRGIQGIGRDVTMRIQLARSRHDAERLEAISKLSRGIAHDFNNILTIIRGHTEQVIEQASVLDPEDREGLSIVLQATQQAELLTLQLMAQSRPEAKRPSCLDVHEVTAQTMRTLARVLPANIQCRSELRSRCPVARIDRSALEQIILNLCLNARDAMPGGGRLTVEVEDLHLLETEQVGNRRIPAGKYVVLAISDDGDGMDPSTLGRVFEPFFTTKGPSKGTGLGLSTVLSSVARCGGYATVESRERRGSSFRILLPWSDEIPRPTEPETGKSYESPEPTAATRNTDEPIGPRR